MKFREYQIRAVSTDQHPKTSWGEREQPTEPEKHEVIPLLGLVGEVGGLLSEYKKMLRDGAIYEQFPEQVAEELGDILWYVATVATKFDLNLDEIAESNLAKTEDRWHEPTQSKGLYDEGADGSQQLPRRFSYEFRHEKIDDVVKLVIVDVDSGDRIGDPLTDNAYEDDGYRYHDVMHLVFAAKFGWSPVYRKLLRRREIIENRSGATSDAEDGGRPQVIEEAIVAAAYVYAAEHGFLQGVKAVDLQLLRHIRKMCAHLEVKDRTAWEWNEVLRAGFGVWKKMIDGNGGIVEGDLEAGTLVYRGTSSRSQT